MGLEQRCYNMALIELKSRPDLIDRCVWKYVWDYNIQGKGTTFEKDDPRVPCRSCSGLDIARDCYTLRPR